MGLCSHIKDKDFTKLLDAVGDEELALKMYYANGETISGLEKHMEDASELQGTYGDTEENVINNIASLRSRISAIDTLIAQKPKNLKQLDDEKSDLINKISQLQKRMGKYNMPRYKYIHQQDIARAIDLLSNKQPSSMELSMMIRQLKEWVSMGNLSTNNKFTEEQRARATVPGTAEFDELQEFAQMGNEASHYLDRIYEKAQDELNHLMEERGMPRIDFQQAITDPNWAKQQTMSIKEIDHPLFQLIWNLNGEAMAPARAQAYDMMETFKESYQKAIKKIGREKVQKLFRQVVSNTDNRLTNNLVSVFTHSYSRLKNKINNEYKQQINSNYSSGLKVDEVIKMNQEENAEYKKTIKKSSEIVSDKLMFDKTSIGDAYRQQLKDKIGEDAFEDIREQMVANKNRFMYEKRARLISLENDTTLTDEQKAFEWQHWQRANDPNMIVNDESVDLQSRYMLRMENVILIPKDAKYLDANYKTIMSDSDLAAAYREMASVIRESNKFIPNRETRDLDDFALPSLRATLIEEIRLQGIPAIFKRISDFFKQHTSVEDRNSGNSKVLKSGLSFVGGYSIKNQVEEAVMLKEIEKGRKLTEDEVEDIELDVINEKSNRSTSDLQAVMAQYTEAAMTMKYKATVVDLIEMCKSLFDKSLEGRTKNGNEVIGNKMTEMLNHFMNAFYGNQNRKNGGKLKWKNLEARTYMSSDLERIKEIDKAIEELKTKPQTLDIERQITEFKIAKRRIGRIQSTAKYSDAIIAIIRFKSLSYNVVASAVDLIRGQLAINEFLHSGEYFKANNLAKAYGLLTHNTLLKAVSGGFYNSGTATIVSRIINKYGLLDYNSQDMHRQRFSKGFFDKVSPYAIMQGKEFLNQAPIVLAVLDNIEVYQNGEKISLLDALVSNDGNVPTDLTDKDGAPVYQGDNLDDAFIKVKIAVGDINGRGYDNELSPIMAKDTALGRQAMMFKGWMATMVDVWYHNERIDINKGLLTRGRISSLGRLYVSEMVKIKDKGGYVPVTRGAINATYLVIKGMLRNVSHLYANKGVLYDLRTGEEFDVSDIRNMQALIAWFTNSLTVLVAMLLYSKMGDDDDDDEKLLLAIEILRGAEGLSKSMFMIINPYDWQEQLPRVVSGVSTMMYDMSKIAKAVKTVNEKWINDEDIDIQSGYYEGWNPITKEIVKSTPILKDYHNIKEKIEK